MKIKVTNSQKLLTDSDIQDFEKKLGIQLPKTYRNFLLKHNGGQPQPNVFPLPENPVDTHAILDWFFSIDDEDINGNSLEWNYHIMNGRIPSNLLPIATDPGGNLICLQVSGTSLGRIYFWDHEEEPFTNPEDYNALLIVANNFDIFIESFTELPG
jgi:cell wall assembly regulator SMI1